MKKKQVLKSSILASIAALLTLFSGIKDLGLKDVTKPYLGEYECLEARFGGTDYLEDFSYITIELKDDETFILHYEKRNGEKKQERGYYRYDKKRQVITLYAKERSFLKLETPLKDGAFDIIVKMGSKTLHMKFEQK